MPAPHGGSKKCGDRARKTFCGESSRARQRSEGLRRKSESQAPPSALLCLDSYDRTCHSRRRRRRLDRAAIDNLTAGIAVRYVPELTAAYVKRWPEQK